MNFQKSFHYSQAIRNEKGFVFVTVGTGLTVFLSFLALVVDLGNIYLTKTQLQNTADSATLAAIVDLPKGTETARQKALDFGQSHYVAGASIQIANTDVEFGRFDFMNSQYQSAGTPPNALVVYAQRTEDSLSGALPLFFAPLFGKDYSNVRAKSMAVLDPHVVGVKGKNRLIPYSVIDFVVDQNGDGLFDVGSTINIHPRTDAPGNFGYLDLNGGANGIPELREYIENGYDKDFTIPPGGSIEVSGSTGIDGNSVLDSFNVIKDEIVFLPVHDWVANPGDNAIFNVIGILAVQVKAVKLNGNQDSRYIRVDIVNFASSVLVTDPNAPENNSLAKPRLVA